VYDYSQHEIKVDCAAFSGEFEPSIKVSTGTITAKPADAGFEAAVNAAVANSPICSKELDDLAYSNQATCGGGNRNIAFKLEVEFMADVAGEYHFDFNVDFGWGGVVQFDGVRSPEGYHAGDHWWSSNLNKALPLDIGHHFEAGPHKMDVYGAEGCCDGYSNVRFKGPNDADFKPISMVNLR